MSLSSIQDKIERFMYNGLIKEGSILDDEGVFYDNEEYRYKYIDSEELKNSNKENFKDEIKKIKFLNEVFDIFTDLHSYIHDNAPENNPYKITLSKDDISIKLESPLEEDSNMLVD